MKWNEWMCGYLNCNEYEDDLKSRRKRTQNGSRGISDLINLNKYLNFSEVSLSVVVKDENKI